MTRRCDAFCRKHKRRCRKRQHHIGECVHYGKGTYNCVWEDIC